MAFLVSPGVNTSEIDLTTSVPAVGTSTGATVGFFRWGPANTVVQVSSEADLVDKFFQPDSSSATSFLSAANFLAYGNDLRVVRVVNQTNGANRSNNAVCNVASNPANTSVNFSVANEEEYFNNHANAANTAVPFIARYPGAVGNSLKVSVCASETDFENWDASYRALFDAAPNTSAYAIAKTGTSTLKDELHIVVVDEGGLITGVKGQVLERFANLSKCSDAKNDVNASIYYNEVLYRNSRYIYCVGHPDVGNSVAANSWGRAVATSNTTAGAGGLHSPLTATTTYKFINGADGSPTVGSFESAIDLLGNREKIDVSLMFAGDAGAGANAAFTTADLIAVSNKFLTVATDRKDAVAFISPLLANCTGSLASATSITNFRNNAGFTSTSYGAMDSGWKYQYDKYNDVYRWIPLNADVAGLCVRTDLQRDPWFSPAGLNRGQIRNVVKLAFNPTQADRDTLYKAGVNPVVAFPGEGTVLFGDKTLQGRPSAFDRINVRRLFIVLEKAISVAARSSLFEFNDEFTRSQFVALVEPFLRDVQGRRGIYDFRVVCDETNNTPAVVDRNEFVGDIYIKPARSVNFIQLNFVAVRSGVAFDEIVGRF